MPSDSPKGNGRAYIAESRLTPRRGAGPEVITNTHQIVLTYGRATRAVTVDHETFMDEEFFKTLVLHQMEAAIEQVASAPSL
jgi:hypothetical protein